MTKAIAMTSACCILSFLLGSLALVNGHADEQQAVPAAPQRSFIGRFQMVMAQGGGHIRILDTATGKYVEQQHINNEIAEWVEIDPIGKKITPERFEELRVGARKAAEEAELQRLRALKKQTE